MEFASKGYFLLLLLLIPYILWYFLYSKKSEPALRMADTNPYRYAPKSWRVRLIHLPMFLRCITFILLVFILARPQTHNSWNNRQVEGINIMLAMDVSTSMLAEDLKPSWRIVYPMPDDDRSYQSAYTLKRRTYRYGCYRYD